MPISLPKPKYTSAFWDIIWSRPYLNYEQHQKYFWEKIRTHSKGIILDLGCGSASCWKGYDVSLVGVDFSYEACKQASFNCPNSSFIQSDITEAPLQDHFFDTIVLSGVVNYYHDLTKILKKVKKLVARDGCIIITINVIKDFPGRVWDIDRIFKEFGKLGHLRAEFADKIGWFVFIQT